MYSSDTLKSYLRLSTASFISDERRNKWPFSAWPRFYRIILYPRKYFLSLSLSLFACSVVNQRFSLYTFLFRSVLSGQMTADFWTPFWFRAACTIPFCNGNQFVVVRSFRIPFFFFLLFSSSLSSQRNKKKNVYICVCVCVFGFDLKRDFRFFAFRTDTASEKYFLSYLNIYIKKKTIYYYSIGI